MARHAVATRSSTEAGCAGCHGTMGEGGAGPALAGNANLANATAVISQILGGGDVMPPFADQLTDAEIAAVATYIRSSWGNMYPPVTAAEVTPLRGGDAAPAAPPP